MSDTGAASRPVTDGQPRDWSLLLVGGFVLTLVVSIWLIRSLPAQGSAAVLLERVVPSLGLMLSGAQVCLLGYWLARQSPRVRLLLRLAPKPGDTGLLYLCLGGVLAITGVIVGIGILPGPHFVYFELGGFLIVSVLLLLFWLLRGGFRRRSTRT